MYTCFTLHYEKKSDRRNQKYNASLQEGRKLNSDPRKLYKMAIFNGDLHSYEEKQMS